MIGDNLKHRSIALEVQTVSSRIFRLLIVAAAAIGMSAQWLNYPTPGIRRTPDGKPSLSAPLPRASNGKPDLSGVWQVESTPLEELTRLFGDLLRNESVPGDDPASFSKYFINVLADFKPAETPLRREFQDIFLQRAKAYGANSPSSRCLTAGIPGVDLLPLPFKIVQTVGLIWVRYEADQTLRQIYTDGRKAPADPNPIWLGYSVGRWDADTLVVDTVGFNDKSWLDIIGHPHSEALHVVEQFRRRDFGHMDVRVTIDDPKMYIKPFSIEFKERLLPDTDILEFFCAENERDQAPQGGH